MEIEKNISFFIQQQFPAIYRENGQELVALIEEYYSWLETTENQAVYNSRRLFEYKDIDTTLNSMLIFFKKKFLADLPFDEENTRFIVKNIMSLYRRRGTSEGLKLFFRLFFEENADIYFPAKDIFKPSASQWKVGSYLQLFPNSGRFYSADLDQTFTYADLNGREIVGSVSNATAIVDKINFIIINNTITPLIYLNNMKGLFIGFDDIITNINGSLVNFGQIYGSVDRIIVDETYNGTSGNKIGDLLTISSSQGSGCKAAVTEISEDFSGEIGYEIEEGGFGYTKENTSLLVSNQSIRYSGDTNNSDFNVLETVEDQFGNQATVIGFDDTFVGFRLASNNEFSNTSNISTLDRDVNFTAPSSDILLITEKNGTSPGDLFPEVGGTNSVKLNEFDKTETFSVIPDVISNFANVQIDSSNYNDPPALVPMSGNTDPITANTTIEDAFDLVDYQVGSIKNFINIDPGLDYINDVFAVAYDPVIADFDRYPQIITLLNEEDADNILIGEIVSQNGFEGKVLDKIGNNLFILPYSYYGFNIDDPLIYKSSNNDISCIEFDYNSNQFGFNAVIDTEVESGVGKILDVKVVNSGFGYRNGEMVDLIDSEGNVAARGTIQSRGTGITGGFWSSLDSHLNGFVETNTGLTYYDAEKYIQDSDFYQEYSYQIISSVNENKYEELLKEIMHVSGTKFFSRFRIEDYQDESKNIRYVSKFLKPEDVDDE